ncbi:Polypeptide-transport-associated domain protein FtsQ-type [Thermaerobacter marianensis DSM 12885]|uniref:Polypeptide-transport-associated domain protein FtsQ-type n=1 Tax=Thermaerobacter marianensis (strain ATCC 700841 / DSM 12885 / JCM 10246 / 7p75a) TaxID=644966 RepID=E6SIZ0_THEM7|nr:FtsQ-type POTRA domain-containing protein [Thermaerobacter marianensis]ADU50985.1 Polypeptide-transport-associated domain protein FtsQ-type [Thermaerobacter marianensis DSM 12885]
MVPEGTSLWAQEVRRRRLRGRRMALAAGVAALLLGVYLFMRSPYFAVDHLRIRGYQRLDPATVRDLAGIPAGTLIWRVDPGAVARRLESHPRIAGAVVRREWPRGLIIELQERATVALLVEPGGDRWAELDVQGRILAAGRGTPPGLVPSGRAGRASAGRPVQGSRAARAGGTGTAGKGGSAGQSAGAAPGADATVPAPVPVLEWAAGAPSGGQGNGPAVVWEPGRFVPQPLAQGAAVAAVLEAAQLSDPPRRLVVGEGGTLEVRLASGLTVRWGRMDTGTDAKVRALAAALEAVAQDPAAARPAYVDVTDPQRPVLGPPAEEPGQGAPGRR